MPVGLSPLNCGAACDALYDKVKGDYQTVHVRSLTIPEDRIRKIDPKSIPGLADSIREVGQISPIGVKRTGTSQYRVVYGARRVLAMTRLLDEAMAKATDPNKDPDVYRYSNMHVLLYRDAIDDETCQELEIRENLDRKELTLKERTAHALQLAACMKRRMENVDRENRHISKSSKVGLSTNEKVIRNGRLAPITIKKAISQAMDVTQAKLQDRVLAASKSTGLTLSLDQSPPGVLDEAARKLLSEPRSEPLNKTQRVLADGSKCLVGNICPSKAPAFALWIRKRYPASFTLDQVRAFRDALIGLVSELEAEA